MPKKINSNQQGREAEQQILSYLQDVLTKLGFTGLKKRKQSSGSQQGKDIQMAWMAEGQKVNWHFEVKSQKSSDIAKKDVLEKIDDAKRSGHEIDCWCLVAIHRDPTNELDDAIHDWNSRMQYPFKIVVWSPETFLKEQIHAVSPALYKKIYRSSDGVSTYAIDDLKKHINDMSLEGKKHREYYPRQLENSLLDSKDDVAKLMATFERIYGYGKDHTDFTIENLRQSGNRVSMSIKPRSGKKAVINGVFKLDQKKHKEYLDFIEMRRQEFELEPQDIDTLKATIGDTKIFSDEDKGKIVLSRPEPEFPEFNVSGERRNYIALRKIVLPFKEYANGSLIFDNTESEDPVWMRMVLEKDGISFKKVHANRKSPDYSIEIELSILDFWEDMITNRSIRIEESRTHRKIVEGNFISLDLDIGGTMDSIHDFRLILKMIRDIRDFTGTELVIPTRLEPGDYDTIKRIHLLIKEGAVKLVLNHSSFVVSDSESVRELPEGLQSEYYTVLNPYTEILFGKEIRLGEVLMEHHDIEIRKTAVKNGVRVEIFSKRPESHTIFKLQNKNEGNNTP